MTPDIRYLGRVEGTTTDELQRNAEKDCETFFGTKHYECSQLSVVEIPLSNPKRYAAHFKARPL